jgi:hypothetical protein
MKKIRIGQAFILLFTLITLSITISSFTNRFGLDKYEFYVNDKLLLKQYVNQPLNLRVLQLDKAKETDQLQIVYSHCMRDNGPGTGRSVTLKDENGNTLHKWVFADANSAGLKMTIAVKDLLQLEKKNTGHQLSLYYSSKESERVEMLAAVRFK